MTPQQLTIGEGLHPRGLFGVSQGVEVPLLGMMSAGSFGVPVESVSLRVEDAPPGVTVLPFSGPETPGVISIPRSEVTDAVGWTWYAWVDDEWCWVANIRDGKLLVATGSSLTAAKDPAWEGDRYNGWDRWIDPAGVELKAESRPLAGGGG
ncbi:hypothetical protein LK09_13160 [Microbacterium mangrovi]|uniref:Uncharacterized protein n=1 Tax=Microbacterium mangrovi TaxID=1348253 RepID=A0A0B2A6M6_9MICO|nr:hypothetical protein [Microbacterium mangrovi]KHK97198.1 hypothetical protein LK09_13160 [Microbacterium mangrovi]